MNENIIMFSGDWLGTWIILCQTILALKQSRTSKLLLAKQKINNDALCFYSYKQNPEQLKSYY